MPGQAYIPVDTDKDLAAAIGRVAAHFAHVELAVSILFQQLLGSPPERSSGIFYTIHSNNTRFQMAEAVLKTIPFNHGEDVGIEHLLDRFKKLNEERNNVIHSLLIHSRDGAVALRIRPANRKPKQPKDLTAEAINSLADDISMLGIEINTFVLKHPEPWPAP